MARVFIGVGHGGTDPGAVGYLVEKDVNLKMARACYDYLQARGIDTRISRTGDVTDKLVSKIDRCNAFAPDLALDIHNNAGGGDGFEIFHSVVGGKGKELAQNIEKEVVFVDNKADAAQADTDAECLAFGEAYARGILATLGIADTAGKTDTTSKPNGASGTKTPAPATGNTSGYKVKVTANGLNIRKDAGVAHTVTGVIRDKGVYTIVAEKTVSGQKWGKLKSGAGWICLAYTKKV